MQISCKKNKGGEFIRAAGLRWTKAREAVLTALMTAGRPMAHQTLAAKKSLQAFDKVTLYRTLDSFRRAGLIHTVYGTDGTTLYCANREGPGCPGGHAHFQCLACGKMRCLHDQPVPHIALAAGVVVKAKQLVAFGLCHRCARAAARRDAHRRVPKVEAS